MRFQDFMWRPEDVVTHLRLQELTDDRCIFLKSDCLHEKGQIQWQGPLHPPVWPPQQRIWISGRSDLDVNDTLVGLYTDNFDRWYGTNNESSDTRIISIPLGMQTNCRPDCIDIMADVVQEPKLDINQVYMNFNINTCPRERQYVYNLFKNKDWVEEGTIENTLVSRTNFLREIKSHQFVLCPRGNGIETHRLWETLYMGSIPIVKKDIGYEDFYDLPICFIDDWVDITEEFLLKEKNRIVNTVYCLDKLKISYWIEKIKKLI